MLTSNRLISRSAVHRVDFKSQHVPKRERERGRERGREREGGREKEREKVAKDFPLKSFNFLHSTYLNESKVRGNKNNFPNVSLAPIFGQRYGRI